MNRLTHLEPKNPESTSDIAEQSAAALATRFKDAAVKIVAKSNCDQVQEFKRETSKTLIPTLVNPMALNYSDTPHLKQLEAIAREGGAK